MQSSNLIYLSIKDNNKEFRNVLETYLLPEPYSELTFRFLIFDLGKDLKVSGNGKSKLFCNKGMVDKYILKAVPSNLAAYITIIGCGSHWRVHPNFFKG